MKGKVILGMALVLLLSAPLLLAQSRETGAIDGSVLDKDGVPLPGVTVTVSGPSLMGTRSAVTDASGLFRFPALPPGVYAVRAELQGFKTYVQENIRLTTTVRLTVDIVMAQTVIEEEVTVMAQSPTVDVKSTESASVTLSNEILRNIPYSQFTADIVNLAPAVDRNVAYGASANTGIAYSMDGVNVADPEAGSAWVFLNHNTIEEAKIMGLGLPAEYGNFTGVIFNLVTKSGGNRLAGHFEIDFQGQKEDFPSGLWQANNNGNYAAQFPSVTSPIQKLYEIGAHLGGPIAKDKLWFYVGANYYRTFNYPTGFPEAVDYKQPHLFLKLTSQLTAKTNLMGSVQIDSYNGINRGASSTVSPEATVSQESPEIVGNFTLTHILSPNTFFDVKAAFFLGYYYLEPEQGRDVNPHYSIDQNMLTQNYYYFYMADRQRFQANASLTHFAEDFIQGNHDFKFGVEVEHSWSRSRFGYPGQNNWYYQDLVGYGYYGYYYNGNYLAFQYEGYDTNTRYTRLEGFVQDSWQVTKRLNINAGLRLSQFWGMVKGISGPVYTNTRLAPRLGFTYDLFGDKSTILKGHYGIFTEAMLTKMIDRLNPPSAFSDYIGWFWDPVGNEWVHWFTDTPSQVAKDPDLSHPRMRQFTVSVERELFKDASLSVAYINRYWDNLVGVWDTATDYELVSRYVDELGRDIQVYNRTSGGVHHYILGNLKEGLPWITAKPYRKYQGVEILFNKRYSNKWQLLASYVYGQAKGTVDNSFGADIGGWNNNSADPNTWIFAEGTLTNDPTHMIKVQASYMLPFEINFSLYFRAITGRAWTTQYREYRLDQGSETVFVEPRGSHHYEMEKTLDIRLEKIFNLADKYRLGILVDVFNVLNEDSITSWGTTLGSSYFPDDPSWSSTSGHQLYGLIYPRRARVGIRLIF
jgi:hypothetical protein